MVSFCNGYGIIGISDVLCLSMVGLDVLGTKAQARDETCVSPVREKLQPAWWIPASPRPSESEGTVASDPNSGFGPCHPSLPLLWLYAP